MRLGLTIIVAGCTNSGLGKTDLASGGTGDTGPTGPVGLQDCPWVGTWNLTAVRCGTFEYDDWYDTHASAQMAIDHRPEGGCSVVTTITGPSCTRTENWTFSVPVGTEVDVDRQGIASCDPEQCAFAVTDPPCNPGDFAGTEPHTIDDSSGSLTVVDLLTDTAPACTLSLVTTWAPQ